MRRTALALMPLARAIRSAVQWVVSTGGSASVSATTRAATSGPSGGMREGRVLSCRRPAMPSFMNRSCQRQTQVFDLPVRRMISLVPTPSALERMIAARQACFCEALRSLVIASSRPRTDRVIVMEIPVRMHQTRTATETGESQSGLFCQAKTTSDVAANFYLHTAEVDVAVTAQLKAHRVLHYPIKPLRIADKKVRRSEAIREVGDDGQGEPAAGFQNDSGLPQGPADLPPAGS